MRSSSGRTSGAVAAVRARAIMRAASLCALSVSILSLVLCAPPPKPAQAPEPSVTLEGDIALAGEDPLDQAVILSDAGGSVCTLASPRFEYELRNLAGHRVRVTGRVTGKTERGPEFLVESYELAPVDGRTPLIGTVAVRGAGLVLVESRSGVEYALAGRLVDAMRAFSGFKVWVDGPLTPSVKKEAPGGTIAVEGYGVLAAPADGNPAPRNPADGIPAPRGSAGNASAPPTPRP
jgi:hypothetical protein